MCFFANKFKLLFRATMFPFWKYDNEKETLSELVNSQPIYLASPNLYQKHTNALADNQSIGKDLKHSLTRYHLRMCTRSTPFGFFAGCGVTGWNDQTRVNTQHAQYHTRLDHLVLHQLAQQIFSVPAIQAQLRYFPNNSQYTVHDELRYVEYTLTDQKRDYKLSAIAITDSVANIMHYCRTGAFLSSMAHHLVETYEVTSEEADAYLQELVASQLLVNEMEPAITGEEYLPRLIRWLEALAEENDLDEKDSRVRGNDGGIETVTEVLILLLDLEVRLAQIKRGATTVIEQGPQIVKLLRPWLPELTENKLFQLDTIFPSSEADSATRLSESPLPAQLSEALTVLNKLASPSSSPLLTRFIERFVARYEDQEVPLANALDSETGIDYLHDVPTSLSPLVEELTPPPRDEEQPLTWTKLQQWRWNLLQNALFHGQSTVELTDKMLKDFVANEDDLPPSISVMFRRVEDDKLYLDSVGGVSATNLINRFAHADPNIHRVVQNICQEEQRHNPDVIFAEIVHLPESRVGNIMFHPTSRAYEIPYLAASSVDEDHQLPLSDLRVSVRGGRIVLRSQRLNKEIIPRLSVAHNYRLSELSVYRFLCDLQGQGLRPHLSFDWGLLAARCKFLPRVTYKNVILRPATWQMVADDFAELKQTKSSDEFWQAFQKFCQQWRLPQRWVLADGDNELFVDSEQPHIVEAWWDLARKREQLVIKEFFAPAEGAVVNERGEAHAHQLVATWIKQKPTYQATPIVSVNTDVARSFPPGSEWLYYKLYGGVSSADRVLEEAIAPLVQRWQTEEKISQWFFIRYADPDTHLRLRFRLRDTIGISEVMEQMQEVLAPFTDSGLLSKIQLDTYERELERYGGSAITEAEALFHHDSEATLQFLSLTEGDAREDLRWLWGLRSIDVLLNDFGLPIIEKLSLLESMKDGFAQEHRIDKSLKLQLDKKYRTHRLAIHRVLALENSDDELYSLVAILQKRSAQQADTVENLRRTHQQGTLSVVLTDLLRSYVHMLVNRLMPSQARLHEMVLYDFLYREYRSEVARKKNKTTVMMRRGS